MLEIEQIREILNKIRFNDTHVIGLYIFKEEYQHRAGIFCFDYREKMEKELKLITGTEVMFKGEAEKKAIYDTSISREVCTYTLLESLVDRDFEKRIINELFQKYLTVNIGNMMKQFIYLKEARGLQYPDQLIMENLGKNLEKIEPVINKSEETTNGDNLNQTT